MADIYNGETDYVGLITDGGSVYNGETKYVGQVSTTDGKTSLRGGAAILLLL